MTDWVQIINHGQMCQVLGQNAQGALLLKNTDGCNHLFAPEAVLPAQVGQYTSCWSCRCPVFINCKPGPFFEHITCSDSCRYDMRHHYS